MILFFDVIRLNTTKFYYSMSTTPNIVCPSCAACPACPRCPECPAIASQKAATVAVVKTDPTTGESKIVVVPESEIQKEGKFSGMFSFLPFGSSTIYMAIAAAIAYYYWFYIRPQSQSGGARYYYN